MPDKRRPPVLTIRDVVDGIASDLAQGSVESPRLEAERLVSHVLGMQRSDLVLSATRAFPADRGRSLAEAVVRRVEGVPLQHIEGSVEFRDLVLVADGRALVPRPETEMLVDLVADRASKSRSAPGVRVVGAARNGPAIKRVLDIGTGSGAIAIALLVENIASQVVAIDRSRAALAQAAENAARAGVDARIRFEPVEDGMWEPVAGERFDVIVSNPPYITDDEIANLPPEVRSHDPVMSLAGGSDGLDVVREILGGAGDHLRSGGGLFVELASEQTDIVASMLRDDGWLAVAIHRDLADRPRFVTAARS